MKLFSQENCAEFSSTQSILFLGCQQVCLILKFSHFDPFRFGNFCCPWQASTGDNNFVVNVRGDAKAWKSRLRRSKQSSFARMISGDASATTVTL